MLSFSRRAWSYLENERCGAATAWTAGESLRRRLCARGPDWRPASLGVVRVSRVRGHYPVPRRAQQCRLHRIGDGALASHSAEVAPLRAPPSVRHARGRGAAVCPPDDAHIHTRTQTSNCGATERGHRESSVMSAAAEDSSGDASAPGECVSVESRGPHAATATWAVPGFSKVRAKQLWSAPFGVGAYSCRLLLYPRGDSQALPGYLSLYLQVSDPKAPGGKWDCFASYRLGVQHAKEPATRSVGRDSWHRFSGKKRSHGWCDFTAVGPLVDPRTGFCTADTLVVTAEVSFLAESIVFEPLDGGSGAAGSVQPGRPDAAEATGAHTEGGAATSAARTQALVIAGGAGAAATAALAAGADVLSGKFTWRVLNFSLFQARVSHLCASAARAWAPVKCRCHSRHKRLSRAPLPGQCVAIHCSD